MGTGPSRTPDARRVALDERLRRLKATTVALTAAAALSLWWLIGGVVTANTAAEDRSGPTTLTQPQTDGSFFSDQQPSVGSGNAQAPALRTGGS